MIDIAPGTLIKERLPDRLVRVDPRGRWRLILPFGRVLRVTREGIETLMLCRCMRPGGYFRHELESDTRLRQPETIDIVPEGEARRLINNHFPLTFPHGYLAEFEETGGFAAFVTPERFLGALAVH